MALQDVVLGRADLAEPRRQRATEAAGKTLDRIPDAKAKAKARREHFGE